MSWDLRDFVRWIVEEFEPAARVAGVRGRYARKIGAADIELYGIADMACVLHTLGALRPDAAALREWRDGFYALSDEATGYILERAPTHGRLHNTAFALAAMNLLGIPPRHPLRFAGQYATQAQLLTFLNALDWQHGVYRDSHDGAGLASCLALVSDTVPAAWFDCYFDRLDELLDPANGMLGIGKPAGGDCDQVGGTFHYAFVYEYFHRRMPHPEARIAAVLGLQQANGEWLAANPWWLTLDAMYLATRAARHCQRRVDDVSRCVRRVVALCHERVSSPADRRRYFAEADLGVHTLTAAISIFAEAQQFLGAHEVVTDWPLQLVLDRRPFI